MGRRALPKPTPEELQAKAAQAELAAIRDRSVPADLDLVTELDLAAAIELADFLAKVEFPRGTRLRGGDRRGVEVLLPGPSGATRFFIHQVRRPQP